MIEKFRRLAPGVLGVVVLAGGLVAPATTSHAAGQDEGRLTITSPRAGAAVNEAGVEVRGTVDGSSESGSQINVMFVVDVSGSTTYPDGLDCNGDGEVDALDNFNGDYYTGDVLDCEISGVLAVNAQLRALPQAATNVAVGVTAFGDAAETADMSPDDDAVFVAPGQTGGGGDTVTPWVNQVLSSLTEGNIGAFTPKYVDGSYTEFDTALDSAVDALAERSGPKYMFFLSDGQSHVSQDRLDRLAVSGITTRTYAVGDGTGRSACSEGAPLADIAVAGSGTCETVTNPADLVAAISEAPSTVESVVVDAPGVAPVTANVDALGNYGAVLTGLPRGAVSLRVRASFKDGTTETDTVEVYAAPDKYTYVALGDSYASGEGIEPYLGQEPEGSRHDNEDFLCHRSRDGWPRKVKLGATASRSIADIAASNPSQTEFKFKACSGAKTINADTVQQTKQYRDKPERRIPLQYDSLDPAVDLVTVSMGGNDLDFAGVVKHCALNAYCYDDDFLTAGNGKKVTLREWSRIRLALLSAELEGFYAGIRSRVSDSTTVIAATYPRLISKDQNISDDLCPTIGNDETEWIWGQIDTFAEIVKYRAGRTDVLVADVRDEFDNHLACDRFTSWIYALEGRRSTDLESGGGGWNFWKPALLNQSAATLHPTKRGAEAYAEVVSDTLTQAATSRSGRQQAEPGRGAAQGAAGAGVDMDVVTDPEGVLAEYPADVVAAVTTSTTTDVVLGRGVAGVDKCNAAVPQERVPVGASGFAPGSSVQVAAQRTGVSGEPVGQPQRATFTVDARGVAGGEVVVPGTTGGVVSFALTGTNPEGGAVRGTSSVSVTTDADCVAVVEEGGWSGERDPSPTPSPSPTTGPTVTPSPTVGPTSTPVPTVTPTPTAGPTVSPTPTAGPTVSPTPTASPTSSPTALPTPVPPTKANAKVRVKAPKKVRANKRAKLTVRVKVKGKTSPRANGRVVVKLTAKGKVKGKKVRTVRVKVRKGKAAVRLPKLAKGRWVIRVTYRGNAKIAKAASKKYTMRVIAPKKARNGKKGKRRR